jgi:hypothetical protein
MSVTMKDESRVVMLNRLIEGLTRYSEKQWMRIDKVFYGLIGQQEMDYNQERPRKRNFYL